MLEVLQTLLNEAAKIERSEALRAAPYERAKERTGYANGFKDKTIHTRMGFVKVEHSASPQSGIYFYVLKAGQLKEIKKMVFTK